MENKNKLQRVAVTSISVLGKHIDYHYHHYYYVLFLYSQFWVQSFVTKYFPRNFFFHRISCIQKIKLWNKDLIQVVNKSFYAFLLWMSRILFSIQINFHNCFYETLKILNKLQIGERELPVGPIYTCTIFWHKI